MDQRIFDQLDKLERGARIETQTPREPYNNSSAEFSAYEGYDNGQSDVQDSRYTCEQDHDYHEQPMADDPFHEPTVRQPDHNSFDAIDRQRPVVAPPLVRREPLAPRVDLSDFAYDPGHGGASTSSPLNQPLLSSPAYNASQRRPPPHEYGRQRPSRPSNRFTESASYQPIGVEDMEAYEDELRNAPLPSLTTFVPSYGANRPASKAKQTSGGPPVVQGINLVSTRDLPDRFRSIFNFPLFNAVQSRCFQTIYKTNENFVLSAPTGSGKTAVLELAICRLINGFGNGSFKIVYQAPTKSLCSERQRDWQAKFGPLDLQCAELTGDTDTAQLRNVQHASIIVTTPEKWDSMTRKWKDHQKLMQMVKLFLIDEVHILKEERGATLEAVVSRMKSMGSDVRFIALSATVPNSQDIATWLGKDPMNQSLPAIRERFGEEFRPVLLQKHVYGYQGNGNEFAFEKMLNSKLTDVIAKHSQRKPVMVFCFTRNACVGTAKLLATWWATKGPKDRYWTAPRTRIVVGEKDLKGTISSGVAFHHAGLNPQDRAAVEKGYLGGDINVICCTSTLAVGVNLPCHMAIIKGTASYQATGMKEYSDLEIMQMLGRAGRPQFDDSAIAVIMTRLQRVQHYEKMITGQEVLESCLHRNLIDHLNAEIGLGTITNASSAKHWLSGTFLYVRLQENPEHYKLDDDAPGRNLEERLENICRKGIALLEEHDLVKATPKLGPTEFGDAMARYYLQFDTMKRFLALPPKAKISEILSAVAQAAEFKEIRFRAGEKSVYKDLNKDTSIKFPIPVNIDLPAHKVSLIIQAVLGALELPTDQYKHKTEFMAAKSTIFQHSFRLIRCIVDCRLYLNDAVSARNALMLARSLGAQVWDDSPLHMKQLDGVGLVYVRRLAVGGIKSIEDIETAEAHRLESLVSRNPPFGAKLQEQARAFPKLRVSMKLIGEPTIKKGEHVTVKVKAEIGFLNDSTPQLFHGRAIYVCLLVETSDGHKAHFARIGAKKLNKGQDVLFSANLTSPSQTIRAHVMCDEIAGTAKSASLKPEIPVTAFPPPKTAEQMNKERGQITHAPNTSKRRASAGKTHENSIDEFDDAGLDDADLVLAEDGGFVDIDALDGDAQPNAKKRKTSQNVQADTDWEPRQLANGKFACNHTCKDKTACKHLCCREGLDKKPKPPKAKENKKHAAEPGSDPKQTQLNVTQTKKANNSTSASTSTSKMSAPTQRNVVESREVRDLDRLHNSVMSSAKKVPTISKGTASSKQAHGGLSFLPALEIGASGTSSDYGMDAWDANDVVHADESFNTHASHMSFPPEPPAFNDAEVDMLDADYGILGDTQEQDEGSNGHVDLSSCTGVIEPHQDAQWPLDIAFDDAFIAQDEALSNGDAVPDADKGKGPFLTDDSSDPMADLNALVDLNTNQLDDVEPDPSSSKSFPATQQQRSLQRTPSNHLVQRQMGRAMRPLQDDFLASIAAEKAQPKGKEPSSPDSVEKWFKEEFGTEHFDFVRR